MSNDNGRNAWAGIMAEDEKILWQGRPDGSVVFKPGNIVVFLFGLVFAGFALFWMIMASMAGGFFWMFGLLHFGVGVGISFGAIFWSAFVRRRTFYTLSDRKAYIATDLPVRGKGLKSYPIDGDTVLDFREGDPGSIYFAQETRRGNKGSTRVIDIEFERVENARDVFSILSKVTRGQQV